MYHFRTLLSWPNLSRASFHVFTFLTHILSSLGSNETTLCFPFTPRAIVAQSPWRASHSASFWKCQQLLRGLSPQASRRSCEAGGGAPLAHPQNSQCLWVHLSQSASQPHTGQGHRDDNAPTMLCHTCHRQEKRTGGLWWGVLLGKWLCTGEDPRESKEKKKEGLRENNREAPRPNSLLHTFAESWVCRAAAAMCYWRREKPLPAAPPVSRITGHRHPREATLKKHSLDVPLCRAQEPSPATPSETAFHSPSHPSFTLQLPPKLNHSAAKPKGQPLTSHTIFLLFLNAYNYASFRSLHFL